ncbi:hypothetical protein RA27_10330 [Ruegeria sp. ANG-R]|uniref:CpsD/CapB family tyrosine-protein kinase n=1 Tax=Ruegeria sp. ANG-R TaxID=1577903 RepID=UPI00057FDD68|nr:CpsD/CapB family tyrosine-protein kinase [Ruegeria sp. ANG-R]KIC41619.1 hypothetical protein RA27_10330 [Ruegeria sp. ANG-R]
MEKLQAALAKARSQRDKRGDQGTSARRTKAAMPQPASSAWERLAQQDLSEEVLRKHLIVSQQANQASSSFDVLRTRVLLQMQQNDWTRLAITSPAPSSGKTTIACNLALGLGRQNDLRTMLFDFDLGDPSIHEFFGIDQKGDFSDVLFGKIPLQDHAVRVRDNVAVVTSFNADPDPTRLLLSDQMEAFITSAHETYQPDIMIFDLPAILSGDRARAFLKTVDCALIVALANRTKLNHFDACEREVAESTNVLGVVLNGCHPSAMSQEDM